MEIQKVEYLEIEKSFLNEIKRIFLNLLMMSLGAKMKNNGHKLRRLNTFDFFLSFYYSVHEVF